MFWAKKLKLTLGIAFLAAGSLAGQGIISTVAGTDWVFPDNGRAAVDARLGHAAGVTGDSRGNLYIADPDNHMVFRITPAGVLTIVAGNGIAAFSGDNGPATRASLSSPLDVAIDQFDNLYIADAGNERIGKVSGGIITTFAGTAASTPPSAYDPAREEGVLAVRATFAGPIGLCVDADGEAHARTEDHRG